MKCSLLSAIVQLTFFGLLHASNANSQDLSRKVNLQLTQASIKESFNSLQQQSDVKFLYTEELLKGLNKKVNLHNKEITVRKAIETILEATSLTYKVVDGYIVIDKKPVTQQPGKVSGKILDDNGETLVGASIKVISVNTVSNGSSTAANGLNKGTTSNADGSYILSLPAGTYTLEVSYMSFQTRRITGVVVKEGKSTLLDVAMIAAKNALNEVVVSADYKKSSVEGLYARQKGNTAITDGISSDVMKQTADNNVAQVLKRVAGVTIQDNKFVVVRGMGERYNNVQLNGSSLPSTEPNRRNFNFDIIPSNLIDNIVVAKTFTPDMQGEFAGGTVQINTLSIPAERLFNVNIGSGFNTLSTGKDMYSNTRYAGDNFLGTSKRDFYKNGWVDEYNAVYDNPEKRGGVAAKLPNHWGLQKFTGQPIQNYAVSGGLPFKIKDNYFGVIAALSYRHEENRENYEWRAPFTPATASDGIKTSFVTSVAAIMNAGWKNKNNQINWHNLYNHRFSHDNSSQTDVDSSDNPPVLYKTISSVRENDLLQTRLDGEHKLFGNRLTFDWFGDFNQLERSQPDDRYNRASEYGTTPTGEKAYEWWAAYPSESIPYDAGGLFTSLLTEKKWNAGANITIPFTVAGNIQKIKTGYWGTFRTSDYKQANFSIYRPGNQSPDVYMPIQELFSPEQFANGNYTLVPFTFSPSDKLINGDRYDGRQNIHAGYLMGDFSFFKKLHVIGGMRLESSMMRIGTITRLTEADGSRTWVDTVMIYKKDQFLPSLTTTYDILPTFKFRAAYSRTLARPDFKERSASMYYDLWERATVSGTGNLKDATSDNYDLRLEWYPSAGEIISFSAFRKDLKNPVEMLARSTNSGDLIYYVNLAEANVKGLEINLRKSFGFVSTKMENLFFTANGTVMDGAVKLDDIEVEGSTIRTEKRDRLPNGLSPLSWNAGLTYADDLYGAGINYNYVGHRIRYAGSNQYLDQFEAGRATLDAQLSCKLMKRKMELKLNASDLLAAPFIVYRNGYILVRDASGAYTGELAYEDGGDNSYNKGVDSVLRKVKRGTTFSMSVSYKF